VVGAGVDGVVVVGAELGVEAADESVAGWVVAAAAVVLEKPALSKPVRTAAAAPSTWVTRRTARRPD
jgi:hypothetical protein